MKKNLFLLVVSLFSLVSCNNKKEEKNSLVGKWRPVEISMKSMDEADRKEFIEHATIEFASDNKFMATRRETRTNGTYTYNETSKQLVTQVDTESSSETYTVGWEGNLLLLTKDDGTVKLKRE